MMMDKDHSKIFQSCCCKKKKKFNEDLYHGHKSCSEKKFNSQNVDPK